jgi:hypothetical protein
VWNLQNQRRSPCQDTLCPQPGIRIRRVAASETWFVATTGEKNDSQHV